MNVSAILQAYGTVFGKKRYVMLAVLLSVLSFFLYISVPVLIIPGNSYQFFLSATPVVELLATALISILVGTLFAMQIYSWRRNIQVVKNTGIGIVGFISGAISTIFASATCISCVSVVFSFLGFGGIIFLTEHRWEIMSLTTLIVLISFYLTSNRIAGSCISCTVSNSNKTVKHREHKKADQGH